MQALCSPGGTKMAAALWPVFTNAEASQLMAPGSMRKRAYTAHALFLTAVVKRVYIGRDVYSFPGY